MLEIRKKEGETAGAFFFRFNKRVKNSGILKESKKRRFTQRPLNKIKRKLGALYRFQKREELLQERKYGSKALDR